MPSFIKKNPLKTMLLALCVGFLTIAFEPSLAGELLTIGGTGTAIGTMKLMVAEFEKAYPHIKIKLSPSVGSSGAIKAVSQGALDIGLNSRPLTPEENKLGISVLDYASTPFVFIANKSVPVSSLTSDELIKIYQGEVVAWPGGERIRIVLRPASDADTLFARTISPGMDSAVSSALARVGMIMALTNQECHDIIVHTPGSIGFSSLTQVVTEKHPVKILSLNGVMPDRRSMADRTYSLSKTLSLVVKPPVAPNVQRFIDYIFSARGKQILERSGNTAVGHEKE